MLFNMVTKCMLIFEQCVQHLSIAKIRNMFFSCHSISSLFTTYFSPLTPHSLTWRLHIIVTRVKFPLLWRESGAEADAEADAEL